MRFSITGFSLTLMISMAAFIFSFQACDTSTKTECFGLCEDILEDTIEIDEVDKSDADVEEMDSIEDGTDIIVDEETISATSKYEKVELIVFDIDGSVLHASVINSI